jgi:hypothetical protein
MGPEPEPEFLTSWSRSRTKMDRLRNTEFNNYILPAWNKSVLPAPPAPSFLAAAIFLPHLSRVPASLNKNKITQHNVMSTTRRGGHR